MLKALKKIHKNGVAIRDIKPQCIAITNNHDAPIAIMNFGSSRIFLDHNGKHIPERENPGFRGTAKYASINALHGRDLSERDDLFSWFYIITEMLYGSLPWASLTGLEEISKMKNSFNFQDMYVNCPRMYDILIIISLMQYDSKPDYKEIIRIYTDIMKEQKINMNDPYDWENNENVHLDYEPFLPVDEDEFDSIKADESLQESSKITTIFDKFKHITKKRSYSFSKRKVTSPNDIYQNYSDYSLLD